MFVKIGYFPTVMITIKYLGVKMNIKESLQEAGALFAVVIILGMTLIIIFQTYIAIVNNTYTL